MIDSQVLMGGGIALAGLVAGIGLVAFTETQGERAKARGAGLSESMSTRITGGLLEDVEVSSIDDLGSLTSQLENALKQAGKADAKALEMSEEEKKRVKEEVDDGW
jgi:flagellar basal body rod protein FlgF